MSLCARIKLPLSVVEKNEIVVSSSFPLMRFERCEVAASRVYECRVVRVSIDRCVSIHIFFWDSVCPIRMYKQYEFWVILGRRPL